MKSYCKKSEKLGMSHTTARMRLIKMILFKLLQDNNLDNCYRCCSKIDKIEDLSIEHKKAWLHSKNPKELYFDLKNISFSHLNCNSISRSLSEEGLKIVTENMIGEKTPILS